MNRSFRIAKNADFQEIIQKGERRTNESYTLFVLDNNLEHARYGISVSKKRGNAVVRNKIRRQIRNILHSLHHKNPNHKDYVIIVKQKYSEKTFSENSDLLYRLLKI